MAKICEVLDWQIFDAIGVSGHTLKHVIAAGTTAMVVVHLARRSPGVRPSRPLSPGVSPGD